jgi:outer membrane immunogenic protein
MKRTLLAGIAAVTMAFAPQAANAADAPVKKAAPIVVAAPTWTGLYIGTVGGWARYHADTRFSNGAPFTHFEWDNVDGGVFGGTVGFNWQLGPTWVIGVEGDWAWATNLWGSTLCGTLSPGNFAACGTKIKDVATLRGRFGFAWGSAFVFGTAGGTWIHGNAYGEQVSNTANRAEVNFNRSGVVYGGGVEFMMTPSLSLKFDALYYDYGTFHIETGTSSGTPAFTLCPVTGVTGCEANLNMWTMRAGLNWRFGWPAAAAVVAKY